VSTVSSFAPRGRAVSLGVGALLALALIGVAAPTAMSTPIEGGNSFQELRQQAQQETTPTQTTASTATTESSSSSGSDSTTLVLGVVAAAVLIGGIAFAIVRDARRVAPAGDGRLAEARSARDTAAMLRRRRAKAKAARRQRKRNR
jgi:hypothetical protein